MTAMQIFVLVLAVASAAAYAGFSMKKIKPLPMPVFDANAACTISEGLDGENPEMAKVFAKGALATAAAFNIPITAREDANAKIGDLNGANAATQGMFANFEEERRAEIVKIEAEIRYQATIAEASISGNAAKVKEYEKALQVFFN